jgi:hypothetical protein
MKFKNNILDKLVQVDTLVNRLAIQINRNHSKEEIVETLNTLKEQIESTREIVSLEQDDFAQQFTGL